MGCNTGMLSEIQAKADQHWRAERLFCWQYGMIRHKSSMILRQWYHFATDFDHALLQMVGILSILFKHCVSYRYRQLTFFTETFKLLVKSCAKLDLQCITVCSVETLYKFKLLYLLNHISCFNKIWGICSVNTHIKYWMFGSNLCWNADIVLGDCFLIGAPCRCSTTEKAQ